MHCHAATRNLCLLSTWGRNQVNQFRAWATDIFIPVHQCQVKRFFKISTVSLSTMPPEGIDWIINSIDLHFLVWSNPTFSTSRRHSRWDLGQTTLSTILPSIRLPRMQWFSCISTVPTLTTKIQGIVCVPKERLDLILNLNTSSYYLYDWPWNCQPWLLCQRWCHCSRRIPSKNSEIRFPQTFAAIVP